MARCITLIPARAANEVTENNGIDHIQKKKVATYCRVSTDQDEQLNSFEAQRSYYTEHIIRLTGLTMGKLRSLKEMP